MFSGISQYLSSIEKIKKHKDLLVFSIRRQAGLKIKKGDSISIDGVCSTIEKINKDFFQVSYMPETIKITKPIRIGDLVNLEPSLKLNDLFGGHLVSGHIDCIGTVKNIKKEKIIISSPKKFKKYIINKGSIAINGISLTSYNLYLNSFEVSLIPYTLKHTNLSRLRKGSKVNLEFDQIAKYVEKISKK